MTQKKIFYYLFTSLFVFTVACKSTYLPSSKKGNNTYIDSTLTNDPKTENVITPYRTKVNAEVNKIIGFATKDITKEGNKESALGNLVSDIQRIKASQYLNSTIDMGVTGSGGLRNPINKGNITVKSIFELMPFENELWVLTLKGETVEKLFKYMGNRNGLSVSNTQITFVGKEPEQILIHGKPFDKTKTYTIATSDYLAGGGDGMFFLSEAINIQKTDKKLRDAIIEYIEDITKQGKQVDANIEGRVFLK